MSEQRKHKIANPERYFKNPQDVVQDNTLSHEDKSRVLSTWEQNERQLLTASNEGMPGKEEGEQKKESNRLSDVGRAKTKLEKSQDTGYRIKRRS